MINTGITQLGRTIPTPPFTFAIIGCGRGGTSAFAAALSYLGIFTGERSAKPTYEDPDLGIALESGDLAKAKAIVSTYNNRHRIWAFKRPSAVGYLESLDSILRNPFYIFVFRDPQSVANRIVQTEGISHIDSLSLVLKNYGIMHDFVKSRAPNGMLVSYEKLILDPNPFLRQIREIAALSDQSNEAQIDIRNIVRASPPDYVSNVRTSKFIGHVDFVTKAYISGWAGIRGNADPCEIVVWHGDVLITKVIADQPRPDVKASGVHVAENCGFKVILDPATPPLSADNLRIQLAGDTLIFNGTA